MDANRRLLFFSPKLSMLNPEYSEPLERAGWSVVKTRRLETAHREVRRSQRDLGFVSAVVTTDAGFQSVLANDADQSVRHKPVILYGVRESPNGVSHVPAGDVDALIAELRKSFPPMKLVKK
jgi:hypothetical protein